MNKVCAVKILVLLMLLSLTGCSEIKEPTLQTKPEEELEEELEETAISENDFSSEIGTLPYRGAVLFINYWGEVDLTDYDLVFDVISDGEIKQENMPVEEVDGEFVATIVDLMYLPGDELDFVIRIQDDTEEVVELNHSEALERYPWKDWMLADDEWFTLKPESPKRFHYDYQSWRGPHGMHPSWDIWTTQNKAVKVYCGTVGIVYRDYTASVEGNLEIYNPYVGAIVQYGHTVPLDNIDIGKDVVSGEHIANIIPEDRHIHYSVIRPFRYVKDKSAIWFSLKTSSKWDDYYWPVIAEIEEDKFIYNAEYYRDPFYWHEPATLGYWYEESLPEGLKEEMISIFKRDNPNITLPATEPIEPLDEPDEQVEPDPEPELEEATAEIVARYFGYPRLSVLIKQKQLHSAYVASTELLEEDIQIPQEVFIKEWNLARIIIPKIDVDLIVLGGVEVFDPENLDKGPVHFGESLENGARYQGSLPNTESGNVAIAGHRGGKWLYFLDLEFLEEGDEIYLDIQGYRFVYHVQRQEVTDQYDWSYLEPTDYPALTLMTGVSKKEYIEPDNYRLFLSAKLHEVTRTPVLD